MITPEKTITDNPFVDNVLYYSKLLALNCTVKDEDEALNNETPESLKRRELLIASVEKTSIYEMYDSIPKEILEKYVKVVTNLDIYAESTAALKAHMNSYHIHKRTRILNDLSSLARLVYINHFEIMLGYLLDENAIDWNWPETYKYLYDMCISKEATYENLFNILQEKTRQRIIEFYINNYDETPIEWIASDINNFKTYIDGRDDKETIAKEVASIESAMRDVFISHYEIMLDRRYFSKAYEPGYIDNPEAYERCQKGIATYKNLYVLFPKSALEDSIRNTMEIDDDSIIDQLVESEVALRNYFAEFDPDPIKHEKALNKYMMAKYLDNYNGYINTHIYRLCIDGLIDIYGLYEYLPFETRKMILNSQIEQSTNIQAYSENKYLFDSYLQSLPNEEANILRANILNDLQRWYPEHYEELNNYYRTLMGLPPLDENGNVMEDTLMHSWDNNTKEFKKFGNRFTSRIPDTIYPAIHWQQQLYEFDSYDIGILTQYGVIDDWISACGADINNSRYRYLKYLGDDALDPYVCSTALNFQLIGIPTIDDTEFRKKFVGTYAVNRDYVIRTVYSDSYKFQSDYYNKFIIVFILINTIMDCLTSIPEYIIDREVFDSRCIKYLFESFGIPYYSEIPVKYQRAMVKNLNILIKYKSSTRNMIDICSLFGFSDVRVFGYYLFKEPLKDPNTGEYLFKNTNVMSYNEDDYYIRDDSNGELGIDGLRYTKLLDYRHYERDKDLYYKTITVKNEDGAIEEKTIINEEADLYVRERLSDGQYEYIPIKDAEYFKLVKVNTEASDLKFIKVPIDETMTEYKNDPNYIIPYDEMVYQDEGDTWDGGDDHQQLIDRFLDFEFNAAKTKYISVETVTEMTELSFQVAYFYNMLFDNLYSEDALTIDIPHIKIGHKFRFMDVVCYLFALMYLYNGLEDNIMYSPTQILYVKGYNFDNNLNEILQDPTAFAQYDEHGNKLEEYEKYNIFDINERIEEDDYNYRDAFKGYGIRAFNLECNVDKLEAWLNKYHQMSLEDFVVDDTLTVFDRVITLRDFFTLHNSVYQKYIFDPDIDPIEYNQDIKVAFDYVLYTKIIYADINENTHEYVAENDYYMGIISTADDEIYIMDNTRYINIGYDRSPYVIYYKYVRDEDNNFVRDGKLIYYRDHETNEIVLLFDGKYKVIDKNGNYIFAADAFYTLETNEDGSEEYVEVDYTDERYFYVDPETGDNIFNFAIYYVWDDETNRYVLDPDNCYIKIQHYDQVTGTIVVEYVKASEGGYYEGLNVKVSEDQCYVRHSDGHFIKFTETDFYLTKPDDMTDEQIYEYIEETCYIISDRKTDYFDPSEPDPKTYYIPVEQYYEENNYIIFKDQFYVEDMTNPGNYIPESELINPNNCYYDDLGLMTLVMDSVANSIYYKNPEEVAGPYPTKVKYMLILQDNNDYLKYELVDDKYEYREDVLRRYVYNSNTDYITVLYNNATYEETNEFIVVLNKPLDSYDDNQDSGKYNPEKIDGIWDENDWFYTQKTSTGEYQFPGEHMWYYKKPGSEIEGEEVTKDPVGSGFYLEAEQYLGDVSLELGEKYYMAFDIETNFTGNIQIVCSADNSVIDSQSNVYTITQGEKQHIAQIFTANDIARPTLRFLIYDYEENPIEVGDFIVISNMRFVKANSDNYIAQDIPSYDRLQELYRTNEAIYKYLCNLMINTDNIHMYNIYKKLYNSLMISKYNKEAFKIGENRYAKTYTEFLETRDAVLYQHLCYFKSLDPDTMHKQVADDIVEVTYAIDDCIDTYSYGYLYSYFPAVSASYIQQYIIRIINFFKSWKVHLLGINTVYKFDDALENTVRALECHKYRGRMSDIRSSIYIYDSAKINPMDDINVSGDKYSDIYKDENDTSDNSNNLVLFSHGLDDQCTIKDRVRIIATTANKFDHMYDDDGELILILNDETIEVDTGEDRHEFNITSEDSTFVVNSEINNMIDANFADGYQEVFGIQHIGEVNSYSIDLTGTKSKLMEDNKA